VNRDFSAGSARDVYTESARSWLDTGSGSPESAVQRIGNRRRSSDLKNISRLQHLQHGELVRWKLRQPWRAYAERS